MPTYIYTCKHTNIHTLIKSTQVSCVEFVTTSSHTNRNALRVDVLAPSCVWHDSSNSHMCIKRGVRDYRVAKTHRMLKLQVIFRKTATNYRALLRKMTCEDKASYGSTPPCTSSHSYTHQIHMCIMRGVRDYIKLLHQVIDRKRCVGWCVCTTLLESCKRVTHINKSWRCYELLSYWRIITESRH